MVDQKANDQVVGPSTSDLTDAYLYLVKLTQGESVKVEATAFQHSQVMDYGGMKMDNSDDEGELAPKRKLTKSGNAPKSSKPSSSTILVDRDMAVLPNCHDSGSEEDVEEVFNYMESRKDDCDYDTTPLANHQKLLFLKSKERDKWLDVNEEEDEDDVEGTVSVKLEKEPMGEFKTVAEVDDRQRGNNKNFMTEPVESVLGDDIFKWQEDMTSFGAEKEIYIRQTGPTTSSTCPYNLFSSVWDESVINLIVQETNKYAWQTVSSLNEMDGGLSHGSRVKDWRKTNSDEIYVFLSVLIYMSLCYRMPIDEYWTEGLTGMPVFRKIMSQDRFLALLKFLHFADNDLTFLGKTCYEKKVEKISPILDHCNRKFQEHYIPKQRLTLDESVFLWKLKRSWSQVNISKAERFGVTSLELCDSESGYLLNSLLYAKNNRNEMDTEISGFSNETGQIVLKLAEKYLDIGHILVMDNCYNQLSLTRYLKSRRTDVLGTVDRKREGVPDAIRSLDEISLSRGDIVARHCGDISLVAWKDVNLVTILSTYPTHKMCRQQAGQAIAKPIAVREYNQSKRAIDFKDRRLSVYVMEHARSTKWYMKVFRRLVNTSLLNTYIIYMANHSAQGLGKQMTHRDFRFAVAELLIRRHKLAFPVATPTVQLNLPVHRLDRGPHLIVNTKRTQRVSKDGYQRAQRRRCARCSSLGRVKLVTTQCSRCNVGLCIGRCYSEYHSLEDISRPNLN